MVKATIKSSSGAVITIEGSEKDVSSVIARLETLSHVTDQKAVKKKASREQKEQKKRATASDLIVMLKEEGFFNKPKSLGEIADGLEEKGYIYPVTTLSGLMIGLVKKKLMGRKKVGGKWVYGK